MSLSIDAGAPRLNASGDLSRVRLLVLRAYYALMAVGSLAVFWPPLLAHTADWGLRNGAQYALLSALAPLALVGLAHPLKMLPLVVYEFLWKALWFLAVVAPLWSAGRMDAQMMSNVFACGIAIVLTPIVVPWGWVWRTWVAGGTADAGRPGRADGAGNRGA